MSPFYRLLERAASGDYSHEEECSVTLTIDGKHHKAYAVTIGYRELLFYCDDLTANYDVNTFGGHHTALLFEVNPDEEITA